MRTLNSDTVVIVLSQEEKLNTNHIILTAIHEECGLFIFSLKMRNDQGRFEPVRFWSYRSFAQAKATRDEILATKFPVPLNEYKEVA